MLLHEKDDPIIKMINNEIFNSNLDKEQPICILEKIAEYSISELNKMCENSFFNSSDSKPAKQSLNKLEEYFL